MGTGHSLCRKGHTSATKPQGAVPLALRSTLGLQDQAPGELAPHCSPVP